MSAENVMEKDQVLRVSPSLVMGSGLNPRRVFSPAKLQEMAKSIFLKGVVVPLMVREIPDAEPGQPMYEAIMGETRMRSASMVLQGFTDTEGSSFAAMPDLLIPVLVNNIPDDEVLELMMTENLVRNDLRPSEEAHGYQHMMERAGLSAREVAARLGVDRRRVDRHLLLLDLPNEVIDRIDSEDLPLYVAQEALKVPAEWLNGDARMDALRLAEEAGSQAQAAALIEGRYLRPRREHEAWAAKETLEAVQKEFGSEVDVLDYEASRDLFPFGTTTLTPVTAADYAMGAVVPEAPAVRRVVADSWAELAAKYGAPVYVAVDGMMTPRSLVRPALVADAARVAHTHEVAVAGRSDLGGSKLWFACDFEVSKGDEVALMVLSGGGSLPAGFSSGAIYFVGDVELENGGCLFQLRESPDAVEMLPLKDAGAGSADGEHELRMAILDLERCPFGPPGGAVAMSSKLVDSQREDLEAAEAAAARVAKTTELLGLAAMAVRAEVEAGRGSDLMLAKTSRFVIACGVCEIPANEHPSNLLMVALEVRDEEPGESLFAGWEGVGETRAGIESFAVCCWLLYFLDTYEGEDVTECPQWLEVKAVYGV